MHLFPRIDNMTCSSANGGHSVLDYPLAHAKALTTIKSFKIGTKYPKSDHLPLWMNLDVNHYQVEEQKFAARTFGFQVNQDKQKEYENTLDAKLNQMTTPTLAFLHSLSAPCALFTSRTAHLVATISPPKSTNKADCNGNADEPVQFAHICTCASSLVKSKKKWIHSAAG